MTEIYPRDMAGYGGTPPHPHWPDEARICLQFVVNYEEGGENNILHGDAASEAFLSEIIGAQPWPGQRHMNMESIYEYGARAGFWRLHRMLSDRNIPVTVFAIATALQRNPACVAAMQQAGWELACHGLKWIDYRDQPREVERAHMLEAIRIHQELTGQRPQGFYQGRTSEHTLDLTHGEGGFLYSADSYADDLPYWVDGPKSPMVIVPYTLDANDMRFATAQGFNTGEQFFTYLKDSFDTLYAEGATAPKMMSVGLHCRLAGRPGRAAALARFLDYARSHDKVWFARRLDIARHWIAHHPPKGGYRPQHMSRALFAERFGGVFEHARWIAESAHDAGFGAAQDNAAGLHAAMAQILRAASRIQQRGVIDAHPDLAGKLAAAKMLTPESGAEQASAGLDRLTPIERDRMLALNAAYRQKFGFVFIMAVRGRATQDIFEALAQRLENAAEEEFHEALRQIEAIARLRIDQILAR